MNTLRNAWRGFERESCRDVTPKLRNVMCHAFYAGALAVLRLLSLIARQSGSLEERGARLHALELEAHAYFTKGAPTESKADRTVH